ncbi:MAG TPA: hypothetical protein VGW74_09460 [Propionibacteriaceae bacterium]|nr:hypothetical protein [Propionibacteriaceae bacterium]
MVNPFAPIVATAHDGTEAHVYVTTGGALAIRLLPADGQEAALALTEDESDRLWGQMAAARASAAA